MENEIQNNLKASKLLESYNFSEKKRRLLNTFHSFIKIRIIIILIFFFPALSLISQINIAKALTYKIDFLDEKYGSWSEGFYADSLRHGVWKSYYDSRLRQVEFYLNGLSLYQYDCYETLSCDDKTISYEFNKTRDTLIRYGYDGNKKWERTAFYLKINPPKKNLPLDCESNGFAFTLVKEINLEKYYFGKKDIYAIEEKINHKIILTKIFNLKNELILSFNGKNEIVFGTKKVFESVFKTNATGK